jgi:imidazolonepropionase-like amidohydrolase
LVEAEFSFSQAIQIGTLNGAKILGVDDELGSIEPGKIADMVLLEGDFSGDAAIIKNTVIVFKDGVGYEARTLLDEVRGRVGIN